MKKKTLNYIQFTKSELDDYTRNKDSCVECVSNSMHISFPPWGMDDFKETLLNAVAAKKVGLFDDNLNGIVLDVRNIKLEGEMSLLRYDTPELHLTIQADFYLFRPQIGVVLKGIVKHVSQKHVSVLIYRVFNVSIRLQGGKKMRMEVGDEITFKVKKFDLQNILPYIEGELMELDSIDSGISTSEEKSTRTEEKVDSSWDTESESEKEFKAMVVKNFCGEDELKTASSSSSDKSDGSASESENEKCPRPIVVKKETRSSSSSGSDSDEPPQVQPQKRVVIKKESKKTPSPEKSAFSKTPDSPKKLKKVTVKEEPNELKLPSIERQIDQLISRYSQSSDTDASGSSSGRKKKTTKAVLNTQTQGKKRPSDAEDSSSSVRKKSRPPTPMKAPPPSDSESDEDDENLDLSLDVNSSINALLNKVKRDKTDSSSTSAMKKKQSKKSRDSTPGSPQLSSTQIESKSTKKSKKGK